MKRLKATLKFLILATLGVIVFLGFCNLIIIKSTTSRITERLEYIDNQKVALVLGTSKWKSKGVANQYFENRIKAAAELYNEGKVKHIIVSGDNGSQYYNEPQDMLAALEKRGVPQSSMTMDYAGFRTLDSVIRAKEVFGQHKIVIVTQRFHMYRSLFIAMFYDIEAKGYIADDPSYDTSGILWREILARAKAILDLYVFKVEPKFLGKKEEIDV